MADPRPVTVVTVWWPSAVYPRCWVDALRCGVQEWLPSAAFRVLTLNPALLPAGEGIALRHRWPGWWSLVEWWRPELFGGQRVLAMGLDSLPVGSLAEVAAVEVAPGGVVGIDDFYRPALLASGAMVWDGDAGAALYAEMARDGATIQREYARMDPWMRSRLAGAGRLQAVVPGQVVSYKVHARRGIPAGARLVLGHGAPKFSEARCGWAHELWCARGGRP